MAKLAVMPVGASLMAAMALAMAPARAADPAENPVFAAYAECDYARAVDLALCGGAAADLVIAARAANAAAYFDEDRKSARAAADRALDLADRAAALDPALGAAHLQSAIAIGVKGARMSPVRAFLSGAASKSRARMDMALALNEADPQALMASAAWRIEVARRGGGGLAGADPVKGRAEFMRARALAPDDLTIAYECAFRLLADGRPEWRSEGLAALDAALAATPATKFARDIQARARNFHAAIAAGADAEAAFIKAHA